MAFLVDLVDFLRRRRRGSVLDEVTRQLQQQKLAEIVEQPAHERLVGVLVQFLGNQARQIRGADRVVHQLASLRAVDVGALQSRT